MAIEIVIHLESTDDPDSPFVWWAESDEFPGFSASAGHLNELLERSKVAFADLVGEEVEFAPKMAPIDEPVLSPAFTLTGDLIFNDDDRGGPDTIQVFPPTRTSVPA